MNRGRHKTKLSLDKDKYPCLSGLPTIIIKRLLEISKEQHITLHFEDIEACLENGIPYLQIDFSKTKEGTSAWFSLARSLIYEKRSSNTLSYHNKINENNICLYDLDTDYFR